MPHLDPPQARGERPIFLGARLLSAIWMVIRGWGEEDAYIAVRVIDHFVEGHGLRWNIAERVQVLTHPLWIFLHIPLYALYRNIFLITLALSWICRAGAVFIARSLLRIHRCITQFASPSPIISWTPTR